MKTIRRTLGLMVLLCLGLASNVGADMLTHVEQLGKSIFFDQTLSINQNQSCAACHTPEVGWTGADALLNAHGAVYEGSIPGRFGNRKPPSSAYATSSPILHYVIEKKEALFIGGNFWDGRATGEKLGNPAADQAQGPFLNPMEQALPDSACVVYRVCSRSVPDSEYPVLLEQVFPDTCSDIEWPADIEAVCSSEGTQVGLSETDRAKVEAAYDRIALAIEAFEASPEVNAFTSKYDYRFKGKAKLSQKEQKGFSLFRGKGKCQRCHPSNGQDALFTDFTYDNLGTPRNPANPFYEYAGDDYVDLGLGGFLATRPAYREFAAANYGKHKVPTLRNVGKGSCEAEPQNTECVVKPFSHNGYFKSLRGIVHFYNTRDVKQRCPDPFTTEEVALSMNCWPAPEYPENINVDELGDLGLTPDEEDAIVAFLMTLSDGYLPEGPNK